MRGSGGGDGAGAGVRERRAPSLATEPCQLLFITVFLPYLSAGERGSLFYCAPVNGSGNVIPISCRYKLSNAMPNSILLLHIAKFSKIYILQVIFIQHTHGNTPEIACI